jgi:hypothetical protein
MLSRPTERGGGGVVVMADVLYRSVLSWRAQHYYRLVLQRH